MKGALLRYRIMAYVVGVLLLVLVFVGVPLHYLADEPTVSDIVSPIHGFLFIVYLLTVIQLAAACHFGMKRMLLMMAAGFVPFLSFVMERRVTRDVRVRLGADGARATL